MSIKPHPELTRYLSFPVANYWCVIPIVNILKIVNCPPPSRGGMVNLGLVQLGPHTIQLIDLHRIFESDSQAILSSLSPFLVVLQPQNNSLWGITLKNPPELIELPAEALKPVLVNEHSTPQNPLVTHVCVISERDYQRTFLRLDLEALTQQKVQQMAGVTGL